MPATADPIAAILTYLKADPDVTALATTRIFGAELPQTLAGVMPKQAIVVRYAGGFGLFQQQLVSSWRIDVWAYGETPHQASLLSRTVHGRLKTFTPQMIDGIKIYTIQESAGPISIREPDTTWPAVISSWLIYFADDP